MDFIISLQFTLIVLSVAALSTVVGAKEYSVAKFEGGVKSAKVGDPVVLPCRYMDTAQQNVSITWLNANGVSVNGGGGFIVTRNGSVLLNSFHSTAEDVYTCLITTPRGTLIGSRIKLTTAGVKVWLEEPTDTSARLGGAARFQCALVSGGASGLQPTVIQWYHNGARINSDHRRIAVLAEGNATLQIVNVEATDAGNYSCVVATNNVETVHSKAGFLRIVDDLLSSAMHLNNGDVMKNYRVLVKPENTTVQVSSDALFQCLAEDMEKLESPFAADISWRLLDVSGRLMLIPRPINFIGQNLLIRNVEELDAGVYACVGKDNTVLGAGSLALDAPLTTDSLQEPPLDQSKLRGETARFHCSVMALSMPEITWYKDGQLLSEKGSIKVFPPFNEPPSVSQPQRNGDLVFKRDLVISTVDDSDRGTYQCFAGNKYGEVTAYATLTVKQDDVGNLRPENLSAQALQNHQVVLAWSTPQYQSSPYTVPAYFVSYFEVDDGSENTEVIIDSCKSNTCSYTCCNTITLKPHTNYTFAVSAVLRDRESRNSKVSRPSDRITVLTADGYAQGSPPLKVSSVSNESGAVFLQWTEPDSILIPGTLSGFAIDIRKSGESSLPPTRIRQKSTVRECRISGLEPGSKYYFRIVPITGAGVPDTLSIRSFPWVFCKLPKAAGIPSVKIENAFPINSTAVRISWSLSSPLSTAGDSNNNGAAVSTKVPQNNNYILSAYLISYRMVSDSSTTMLSAGGNISMPASASSVIISDLLTAKLYEISVAGVDASGSVGPETSRMVRTINYLNSNEVIDLSIEPPSVVHCETLTTTRILLTWQLTAATGLRNLEKFLVYGSTADAFTLPSDVIVEYLDVTKREFTAGNLKAGTLYQFAVKSISKSGYAGPYSTDVQCKTQEEVPGEPIAVNVKELVDGSVLVSWFPPLQPNGILIRFVVLFTDIHSGTGVYQQRFVNGSTHSIVLKRLERGNSYVFFVAAENSAGRGKQSTLFQYTHLEAVTISRHHPPEIVYTSYTEGIIVGLGIAVSLIALGILLFVFRKSLALKLHLLGKPTCDDQSPAMRCSPANEADLVQNMHEVEALLQTVVICSPDAKGCEDELDLLKKTGISNAGDAHRMLILTASELRTANMGDDVQLTDLEIPTFNYGPVLDEVSSGNELSDRGTLLANYPLSSSFRLNSTVLSSAHHPTVPVETTATAVLTNSVSPTSECCSSGNSCSGLSSCSSCWLESSDEVTSAAMLPSPRLNGCTSLSEQIKRKNSLKRSRTKRSRLHDSGISGIDLEDSCEYHSEDSPTVTVNCPRMVYGGSRDSYDPNMCQSEEDSNQFNVSRKHNGTNGWLPEKGENFAVSKV